MIQESVQALPHCAGVYQYWDQSGRVLYVGKAKDLAKRVKSYFRFTPVFTPKTTLSLRIQKMLSEAFSLHTIVVENEHDALILENSLIKQLKPKYNILLRDDKTYPYIYLDTADAYPRFEITRKVIKGSKIRYFGPYSTGARDILDSLYELLPLVQKKGCLKGKKRCLFYQMKQCLGPCEEDVPHYADLIEQGVEWIHNKDRLIQRLEMKMHGYAEELRFEEALVIKERLERIGRSELKSDIDLASHAHYDVFAIAIGEDRGVVVRIFIRDGRVVSSTHDFFGCDPLDSYDEAYERSLMTFYAHEAPPIVAPIVCAHEFESRGWVEEHLSQSFGKKVSITIPKQGKKYRLALLALHNARALLSPIASPEKLLMKEICTTLGLERLAYRVEVFDNSHHAGSARVGAMIVYQEGHFDTKGYRLYHLEAMDEYPQMREMLTRRIGDFEANPPPDLWVIDGGEVLRALAVGLLESVGVGIDVVAISKEKLDAKAYRAKGSARDHLYTQHGKMDLKPNDKRLQWFQKLRDEAHRSAITFHQKTKTKQLHRSGLGSILTRPKIDKLLQFFGTFEAIEVADEATLGTLVGAKEAKKIRNFYEAKGSK